MKKRRRSLARLLRRWWHGGEPLVLDEFSVDEFLGHYTDWNLIDSATVSPKQVVAQFHPGGNHVRTSRETRDWIGRRQTEYVMRVDHVHQSIMQTLYLAIHMTTDLPTAFQLQTHDVAADETPTDVAENDRMYVTVEVSAIHATYQVDPTADVRERRYEKFTVDRAVATKGLHTVAELTDVEFTVERRKPWKRSKRKHKT